MKTLDLELPGKDDSPPAEPTPHQRHLQRLKLLDTITWVYNRDFFDLQLDIQWNIAARKKEPLTLFIVRLDRFEAFNEKHGQRSGDYALQKIARTLKLLFRRASDFIARYEADQFVILAADMDPEQVRTHAERIIARIDTLNIFFDRESRERLPVLVDHVSLVPTAGESPQKLVDIARKNR